MQGWLESAGRHDQISQFDAATFHIMIHWNINMQSSVRHHYRLISGTIHRFAQCAPRSASDPIGGDYVGLAAFLGESERFHTSRRPSVSLCRVQSRKNEEKPRYGNGARQTQDK